jgi:mono/diheme cytochrome c family protein
VPVKIQLWRVLVVPAVALAFAGTTALVRPPHTHAPRPWWTDPAAIRRGYRDFATGPCISCHTIVGVSSAGGAADLTHEGRRRSIRWLLHELAHPTSLRPPIPRGQLRDLAAYLESLR